MRHKRPHLIPILTTRVTAIVSVALVLVILGMASLAGVVSHRVTNSVRESIGFVVVFGERTTASDIEAVTKKLSKTPGVKEAIYSSPEEILQKWQKVVGPEEDIMDLAGVNPFLPELEVHVWSQYAHPDSLDIITAPLGLMPQVQEVKVQTELANQVNHTLRNVTFVLLCVGCALLIVSFVLIFNTVRLTVYNRRFTIHTMRLVGATFSFIRRPFLLESMYNGLIAGLGSAAFLALLAYYAQRVDSAFVEYLPWSVVSMVLLGVVLLGMVICLIAAYFAITRCLKLSYDEMFR